VKNQDPDPGWISRIIFPRAQKQYTFFDADPGSIIFFTLDPGWEKFSDLGAGINIPDPQL
jgi:hypothetical protein